MTSATPEPYYFAYGANLNIAHMKSLCPGSAPLCFAHLEDHILTIALPETASPDAPGWATVTPETGGRVLGALFHLRADDLPALDRFEGYPTLYNREEVEVATDDGPRTTMIYVMRRPLRAARPTAQYVETLREGYRNFGLPMAVLEDVLEESSL